VQFETTNICNHGCQFCAYTKMERPKRHMDRGVFERLVKEAYDLGAREIGLFSGAEPLTCKWLDEYVAYAHAVGYEYSYISTNGVLGGTERIKRVIDAGLRSIKFSINGGTRESYRRVHGKDDFEKALANVRFVSAYRKSLPHRVYLSVSFVECADSAGTFDQLKALVGDDVDEIVRYQADHQVGQVEGLPQTWFAECPLPFKKAHFSVEGYLRVCCNDYENMLAVEDLAGTSLMEAWHSERFRSIRRQHIEDRLEGTQCGKCIRGQKTAHPLNPALTARA
jgi:hypothetical protein